MRQNFYCKHQNGNDHAAYPFALYFVALSRRNVKENMAIQGTPHNNQKTVFKK